MSNPSIYQYYDLEYYDPDSPQRVDIQAGLGYWIYADTPMEVDFEGVPTNPAVPVDVPLAMGWNLIGNPYADSVAFNAVTVVSGGEDLALSEAVMRGLLDGRLFQYNPATGGYDVLGQDATLNPKQGYVVKALQPCTLRFP